MTKRERILQLKKEISELINIPNNREEAVLNNKETYLYLDFHSDYGGYRLIEKEVKTGAHLDTIGFSSTCGRLSYKEFVTKLEGIVTGLNYILQVPRGYNYSHTGINCYNNASEYGEIVSKNLIFKKDNNE